jgi:hypothetical protein
LVARPFHIDALLNKVNQSLLIGVELEALHSAAARPKRIIGV